MKSRWPWIGLGIVLGLTVLPGWGADPDPEAVRRLMEQYRREAETEQRPAVSKPEATRQKAARAEAARRKAQAEAARAKPPTVAPPIELVARSQPPVTPDPPAAPATGGGGGTVVATYAMQDNAYAVRDRYRSRNIRAAVEQTTANGRPLYLVRIWR